MEPLTIVGPPRKTVSYPPLLVLLLQLLDVRRAWEVALGGYRETGTIPGAVPYPYMAATAVVVVDGGIVVFRR
jgi:hypothetical protein